MLISISKSARPANFVYRALGDGLARLVYNPMRFGERRELR